MKILILILRLVFQDILQVSLGFAVLLTGFALGIHYIMKHVKDIEGVECENPSKVKFSHVLCI